MSEENNGNRGVGFAGLLTIVFIALKLMGEISWPWIWVFSPIWISFGLLFVIWIIIVIFLYVFDR